MCLYKSQTHVANYCKLKLSTDVVEIYLQANIHEWTYRESCYTRWSNLNIDKKHLQKRHRIFRRDREPSGIPVQTLQSLKNKSRKVREFVFKCIRSSTPKPPTIHAWKAIQWIKLSRLLFHVFPALDADRITFPFQQSKKFDFVLSHEKLGCSVLEEWSNFYCLICCAAKSNYFLHSVENCWGFTTCKKSQKEWEVHCQHFYQVFMERKRGFFWIKELLSRIEE